MFDVMRCRYDYRHKYQQRYSKCVCLGQGRDSSTRYFYSSADYNTRHTSVASMSRCVRQRGRPCLLIGCCGVLSLFSSQTQTNSPRVAESTLISPLIPQLQVGISIWAKRNGYLYRFL